MPAGKVLLVLCRVFYFIFPFALHLFPLAGFERKQDFHIHNLCLVTVATGQLVE